MVFLYIEQLIIYLNSEMSEMSKAEAEAEAEVITNPVLTGKGIDRKIYGFLDKWKHLPEQGTQAWLDGRLTTIGGSELENCVKNPADVIARKLKLVPRFNSPYMTWGNVMEDQCRMITEWLFNTTVYEAGSVPSVLLPRKTFSMDGICMVPFKLSHVNGVDADGNISSIAVHKQLRTIVEYKSPSRYIPKQSIIPPKYVKQINSGLSDVDIAEIGLFMEMVYKIAPIDSLSQGNRDYALNYHESKKLDSLRDPKLNPAGVQDPLTWGVMGLYITSYDPEDEQIPSGIDINQIDRLIHGLVSGITARFNDLSKLSPFEIDLLYNLMKSGFIKIWHFPMHTDNDALRARVDYIRNQDIQMVTASTTPITWHVKEMNKVVKKQNGYILGYFGWKLFEMNIVPIEKNPTFTMQYKPHVDSCCEKLDFLRQFMGDHEKLVEEFLKLFPDYNSKHITKCEIDKADLDILLNL